MKRLLTISALFCALTAAAKADDLVKVAIGQRGNWDTAVFHLGDKAGIFKKHGVTQELLYTSGGGETQQAVLSGSVDVGVAAGIMGVHGVYSKGAPMRLLGLHTTGAADSWYANTDYGVNTLKDIH